MLHKQRGAIPCNHSRALAGCRLPPRQATANNLYFGGRMRRNPKRWCGCALTTLYSFIRGVVMKNKIVSVVVCTAATMLVFLLLANSLIKNIEKNNRDAYRYHLEYLARR